MDGEALRRVVGIPGLGARLETKGAPMKGTSVEVLPL